MTASKDCKWAPKTDKMVTGEGEPLAAVGWYDDVYNATAGQQAGMQKIFGGDGRETAAENEQAVWEAGRGPMYCGE